MAKQLAITLVLFSLMSFILLSIIEDLYFNKKLNINSDTIISIEMGSNIDILGRQLVELEIVSNLRLFKFFAVKNGIHNNIRAGDFLAEEEDTLYTIIEKIKSSDEIIYQYRIIEGEKFINVINDILSTDLFNLNNFSLDKIDYHIDANFDNPEGLFYPDTYNYTANIDPISILQMSHDKLYQVLINAWEARDSLISLSTPYEALIIASIIEREAVVDDERSIVSGVIHRRLNKGMPLQMDPTVLYGLSKDYDESIMLSDLRYDTLYNTYTRAGLPPSPICLPSRLSIEAALNPDKSEVLYFVATGLNDGRHQFSESLEEHNEAVSLYRERASQQ